MDFKSILNYLSGPSKERKIFYTEPEIQAQRDALEKLKMTGVSQMVVDAHAKRLADMEANKQQPVDAAARDSDLDFLNPKAEVPAPDSMGMDFPPANDQRSSFDVNVSDTTVPMQGRMPGATPSATPPPEPPYIPEGVQPPVTPDPLAGGKGAGPKGEAPKSSDEIMQMGLGDLSNDDQAKRDALSRKQKDDRIKGIFPQALAGFADALTASGAPYGTKGTNYLDKTLDIDEKQQKTEKDDLEKKFLTDPTSGMSKIAQSAAARLLGKKPEELQGLSLAQIDKAFPIWKEALNNEQAKELKKLQLEAIKAQKEMAGSAKSEQFKEKQIQQIRQNLTGGKGFQNMQSIDYNGRIIEDSLKNPNGYGDLGAMFAFMKALDPTSVVREGEQDRFVATASLPTSMVNTLNKWATGKTLQPQQRQQVAEFAKKMRGHALEQYKQGAKPSIEQAKRLGYNLSEIDPMFEDAPEAPAAESKNLPVVSSQAEYDALPVGAKYQTADGKTGTKRK